MNFEHYRINDTYDQPLRQLQAPQAFGDNVILNPNGAHKGALALPADGNRYAEGTTFGVLPQVDIKNLTFKDELNFAEVLSYAVSVSNEINNMIEDISPDHEAHELWLSQQQAQAQIKLQKISIDNTDNAWEISDEGLLHRPNANGTPTFFTIDTKSGAMTEVGQGVIQLPTRKTEGLTQVLVSFRVEPGNPNGVIGPSYQFSASNADRQGLNLKDSTAFKVKYPDDFYKKTNFIETGTPSQEAAVVGEWVDLDWLLSLIRSNRNLINEHLMLALAPLLTEKAGLA